MTAQVEVEFSRMTNLWIHHSTYINQLDEFQLSILESIPNILKFWADPLAETL